MAQHMQTNVTYHINKRKDKNHTIISKDTEKAFDKIQHPSLIKKKTSTKVGGEQFQHHKSHLQQSQSPHNI